MAGMAVALRGGQDVMVGWKLPAVTVLLWAVAIAVLGAVLGVVFGGPLGVLAGPVAGTIRDHRPRALRAATQADKPVGLVRE
jgi:hypothetical protein